MNQQGPSRRGYVVACLCSLAFLTIFDRVCISAAKSGIATELGINDATFGWVFGVFAVGYTLMMVPSGWLADRYGPRKTLALCVIGWSICTAFTGWAQGAAVLLIVRFFFGLAEAGAFPSAARAIATWLPVHERGLAMGLLNTGSRLGAAAGLWGMSLSVLHFGWRNSFVLLAAVGIAWAVFWFTWFRDRPRSSLRDSAPPKPKTVERSLLRSRSVYMILFQYFASQVTFFLCFSWLLPYMQTRYQLSGAAAGMYASIPLYVGALANWVSGTVVDKIYKKGRRSLSRKLPAMFGFALASVALLIAAFVSSVNGFVLFFSIATFGVDLTLSPSWTACADIGGQHTGTLSGAMNMMGSVGSFVSAVSFPLLFSLTGGIKCYFIVAIALNLLAVASWWLTFKEE